MIFKDAGTVMPVWQITRVDPGYIYIAENHGKYKIGKSKRGHSRLNAARTWLPDMSLIGQKPFWGMSHHERCLHTGFVRYWYSGEWFDFTGDDDALDLLLEGFAAFSDDSPDRNLVGFHLLVQWRGNGRVPNGAIETKAFASKISKTGIG